MRMQVEDLRQTQLSPYTTGNPRWSHMRQQTWRELGEERNERCDYVTCQVIEPAFDILRSARTMIRNGRVSYAYNAIIDAETVLEERESAEDEEEDGEDSESGYDDSVATGLTHLNEAIDQDNDSDEDDVGL